MLFKLFHCTRALLFLVILFTETRMSTSWDTSPECPSCLPPPTSVTNCPPPPPPAQTTPTAGYPPPPSTPAGYWSYPPPPPSGYNPYYPAPPFFGFPAPPPPNPILPWFPWYYKTPPQASAAAPLLGKAFTSSLAMAMGLILL